MRWMKASLIVLSVALLSATTPMPVGAADRTVCAGALDDYAAREAQAPDLAQFTGGALVEFALTLALLVIVVWLVLELCDTHIEIYHHPTHPPPEPRP
ncbi:MAG TPA: hypothetical protein VK661_00725 [Planctomycetota bacterium]|nr:hypothetical protein [Planctomycetota bacterium]